ncbi:MAG: hypothetical protein H6P99_621 [Holophagaceae bacterium]|nr:hypothetical protein [Holophagaceae bacterium]
MARARASANPLERLVGTPSFQIFATSWVPFESYPTASALPAAVAKLTGTPFFQRVEKR